MKTLKQLYQEIEAEGLEKIALMIHLALDRAGQLFEAFSSSNSQTREKARKDAVFVLQSIDLEILKLEERTGISQEDHWKRLRGETFFTPAELKAVDHYFAFIKRHRNEIFEKPMHKNTQHVHPKNIKFKA